MARGASVFTCLAFLVACVTPVLGGRHIKKGATTVHVVEEDMRTEEASATPSDLPKVFGKSVDDSATRITPGSNVEVEAREALKAEEKRDGFAPLVPVPFFPPPGIVVPPPHIGPVMPVQTPEDSPIEKQPENPVETKPTKPDAANSEPGASEPVPKVPGSWQGGVGEVLEANAPKGISKYGDASLSPDADELLFPDARLGFSMSLPGPPQPGRPGKGVNSRPANKVAPLHALKEPVVPMPLPVPWMYPGSNIFNADSQDLPKGVFSVKEWMELDEMKKTLASLNLKHWERVLLHTQYGEFTHGLGSAESSVVPLASDTSPPGAPGFPFLQNYQSLAASQVGEEGPRPEDNSDMRKVIQTAKAQLGLAENAVAAVDKLQEELANAKSARDAQVSSLGIAQEAMLELQAVIELKIDGLGDEERRQRELKNAQELVVQAQVSVEKATQSISDIQSTMTGAVEESEVQLAKANLLIFDAGLTG